MVRNRYPRFLRGKVKTKGAGLVSFRVVSDVPRGSSMAHPRLLRRFLVARISGRYRSDVVRRYVQEIGMHLSAYANDRHWLSEKVMAVLVFPEEALGMRQAEPYEIGARDSEVLDMLGFSDARRREICRFVFYRAQGRPFDAVEAASLALIEIERATNPSASDSDIVSAVRRTEKAALRAALFE